METAWFSPSTNFEGLRPPIAHLHAKQGGEEALLGRVEENGELPGRALAKISAGFRSRAPLEDKIFQNVRGSAHKGSLILSLKWCELRHLMLETVDKIWSIIQ